MFKNLGKELRDFILRGNVMDMAVGIIIGAAFGKIVDSLVKDIIMPPIGFILGKVDFSNLYFTIYPLGEKYDSLDAAAAAGAVVADRNGSLVHISLRRRLREFNQDFVLIEGGNLLIPMSGRLIRDLDQTALLQFLDMTCQRAVGDFQAGGEIVHIHVVVLE